MSSRIIGRNFLRKKVILIDGDPQASLTISLDHPQPDTLSVTLSDVMGKILMDQSIQAGEGILHHAEGVDLMPANIQLSGMEVSLVNAMSRKTILRQYLDTLRNQYTHILIDCQPSLDMLTVNALAAADRIIVPAQPEYLPAKGLIASIFSCFMKNVLIWILFVALFLFGVYSSSLVCSALSDTSSTYSLDGCLFEFAPLMGIISAIFISFFRL